MRLSEAERLLSDAGVPSARHDARAIFSEIGNIPMEKLLFGDAECEAAEVAVAVKRRAAREPLQYIIGEVGFYNESYIVNKDCLIPRQDTETLVEYAVSNIPEGESFIDICTGSGCVAISVLANTKGTHAVMVDVSEGALCVAEKNAIKNGVSDRCERIAADALAEPVIFGGGKYFAVLSNPPYVREDVYETLDREIRFAPRIAFVGGEDGSVFYRRLVPLYKEHIKKDGFMAFEIGYDQAELLLEIADENGMAASIIRDLSGKDRVAVLRFKNQ